MEYASTIEAAFRLDPEKPGTVRLLREILSAVCAIPMPDEKPPIVGNRLDLRKSIG
jgi:hypothetical protein